MKKIEASSAKLEEVHETNTILTKFSEINYPERLFYLSFIEINLISFLKIASKKRATCFVDAMRY